MRKAKRRLGSKNAGRGPFVPQDKPALQGKSQRRRPEASGTKATIAKVHSERQSDYNGIFFQASGS
jgi:hypothetical protein